MNVVSAVFAACLVIAAFVGFLMKAIGEPVTALWIVTLAVGMLMGFIYGFIIGMPEQNPPK